MFERSIGIRLTLLPAFAEATKLILSDIGEINKGLQSINENGSKINVDGLKVLNTELSSLVGGANAAAKAITELNGIKITKNTLSAMQIGLQEVSVSAKQTQKDIAGLGDQTAQTAKVIEEEVGAAAKSFSILGQQILNAERALAKLGLFAMPNMNTSIIGMHNIVSEIMLAESAMRRLDSFAPRQLEDTVLRLNSGLQNLRMLASSQQPLMLGPGPAWATGNAAYNNARTMSLGAGAAPEQAPWTSVRGNSPYMLGPGQWSGNNITPYALNQGINPQSTPYEPGNRGQVYEGPGAITPYVQDLGRGQWQSRNIPGSPNYGPMIPANYGSEGTMNAGRGIMRHGDVMQSAGWSGAMNAIILESVLSPLVKSQMDIQDLYGVAGEALQAVGARPKNYQNIMSGAEEASTKYGGSLRENVSGMYTFASSVPTLSKINWNDPQQAELMKKSYEKITEGSIIAGRSTHPVSQEHSILDILASVTNLGMPMKNAKELGNSINVLTDVFTNIKNSTSTDFDLLGTTVRNVGAVAHNMGVSWQDTMALTGLLAEGKYRGSIAGTSLKRIFSRQAMDPKQAAKMEELVASFGGNVSMYDKQGAALSPLGFFANIAKFEDQHLRGPNGAKARSKLEGSLSGLYAGAPMGELVNLARGFGGSEGLKKYEKDLVGGAPGATDRAYQTRDMNGQNIKIEGQKVDNSWQLEMHKTFVMMQPDLVNALHGIQKLIGIWHGMSDPVKKFILDAAALALGLSAITGISGILIGNFLKMGGTLIFLSGNALKLVEHFSGFVSIIPRMIAGASGLVVAMGPIGWTISAVILAVGALAIAWSKDWGGIREKTAEATSGITTEFHNIMNGLSNLAQSGMTYAKQFGDGVVHGFQDVASRVKSALNPIGNLFPHSEPKDSSSPLAGMGHSGQAYSDQFIEAAIMGFGSGAKKVKKAAKPIGDVFIELKSESVQHVQEMAKQIEQELIKAGTIVKNRWIDLYNPKTGQITRVHGDIQAYRVAVGKTEHDDSVQKAHDYLQKIHREILSGMPVNIDKAIATLTSLSVHALSEHAMAQINQMIFMLRGASEKAGNEIKKAFESKKTSFDSQLQTVNNAGNRFDLIQQDSKIPTLSSEPTSKELQSVIKAETSERNILASVLLNENEDVTRLQGTYEKLEKDIATLNGTSKYEAQIRAQLKGELSAANDEYGQVTAKMTQQKAVVDGLTASVKQQTDAIHKTKDTWSGMFYNIQQHNAAILIDQNFKSLADHVQNYFNLQNSSMGSAGNSAGRQQANNFANQAIQQLFQQMFDTSATSSLVEKIFSGHAGKKGNKHEAAIPPTLAETKLIEHIGKANTQLDKIAKNTEYLNPKNISGMPTPVTMFDQSGGTDLGQSLVDVQNAILNNNVSATYSGGSSISNNAGEKSSSQTSLQKFQGLAGQVSEGLSLINGLKAGGLGGAIQSGSTAFQMTGNPYIAGAAALVGFLGIGPHETPAQQPDLNDTTYQQLLPNWAGTQQILGNQVIQPNQQYSKYAGNQNMAQQTYSFISNPSSQIGMNPQQIQQIQQLQALANNKSGISMGASGLAIKSEHQGQLTLASGQTISVTDFETLVNSSQGMLSAFNNNVLQQQQNADRLASSFTSFVLNGPQGFKMPDFVGGGSGGLGVHHVIPSTGASSTIRTSNMGLSNTVGDLGQNQQPAPITINILQGGSIHGSDQASIQAAIQAEIPSIIQAVGGSHNTTTRLTGSYVSNTF